MAESRTVRLLFILLAALVASALLLVLNVPAGYGSDPPISVNSTADDVDPNDGDCTLREAITAANTGTDSGAVAGECEAISPPVIWFAIPTSDDNYDPADDFWTIPPASPLPAITTDGTIIDGYSQDQGLSEGQPNTNGPDQGSNAVIKIELDGVVANSDWGLRVDASNTSIRGFAIGRFNSVGVFVASGTGNIVAGNFLGTDFSGSQDRGNLVGVAFTTAANQAGGSSPADRNVISGNDFHGVNISGSGASGNSVYGNLIGLAANGAALGNHVGVSVDAPGVNFIGGTSAAQRNVISANSTHGIELTGNHSGNIVRGNYIGTTIFGDGPRGNGGDGISIRAPDMVIGGTGSGAGNLISGNAINGIELLSVRTAVQGNYIGVDATGMSAIPNLASGVKIGTTAPTLSPIEDHIIGGTQAGARNVISGNGDRGVLIQRSDGNTVQSNYIGTDATGFVAIPNDLDGVMVEDSADVTIGGIATNAGNLISGNNDGGIYLLGSSTTGAVIQGNYIGLNASGSEALQNEGVGIFVWEAPGVLIGGSSSEARNVISGNDHTGVDITDANDAIVRGNYIGTDVAGMSAVRNFGTGLLVFNAAHTTIGGGNPADRNVISGNFGWGIGLGEPGSTNILIQGNYIGVGADGSTPIGNESGGIDIIKASDNTIEGNVIAHNKGDGIGAISGQGNSIVSNSIFANHDPARPNQSLGIDLEDADDFTHGGVTPNDAADPDAGANNLQNYPELTSAASGSLSIKGSFDSTPNATFRVEFFVSDDCDPSGHGEGKDFLGTGNIATDGDGVVNFTANSNEEIPVGKYITATATNLTTNDTSEFSNCVEVAAPPTPTPTLPPGETPSPTPEGQTPTPTPIPVETSTPTTPTPTPTATPPAGESVVWGDGTCSGSTDPVDSLLTLRFDAGLSTSTGDCPDFGQVVDVANASPHVWGDIDCSGDVTPVDSLKVLRFDAGLDVSQGVDCPPIGSEVLVVEG